MRQEKQPGTKRRITHSLRFKKEYNIIFKESKSMLICRLFWLYLPKNEEKTSLFQDWKLKNETHRTIWRGKKRNRKKMHIEQMNKEKNQPA